MHPTTKIARLINYAVLNTFARALDQYPLSRTISGRGFYILRHFGISRGFLILACSSVFIVPFIGADIARLE